MEVNTARQKIEIILRNINRSCWLEGPPSGPDCTWDDILIPYSKDLLPKQKPSYRTQFLEEQKKYLSDPSERSQQIEAILRPAYGPTPPHLQILDIGKVFDLGRKLGEGTFGKVVEAKWPPSHSPSVGAPSRTFAVKLLPKLVPRQAIKNSVESFKTERHNLELSKKHEHHHLVSFHASFTDQGWFGFIMSPVAESNLKRLLERSIKDNVILQNERESLSEAFGCLLEAVRHLHVDLKMRHCDLKPSNILVYRFPDSHFRVRICDLGVSYTWKLSQDDSTEENQRGTRKYKAPELVSEQATTHNRKMDIFSLGVIFLEMYTVLGGRTLDEMAKVIRRDPKCSFGNPWTYAKSLSGVNEWLKELQRSDQYFHGEDPVSLITDMVRLRFDAGNSRANQGISFIKTSRTGRKLKSSSG